MSGGKFRQHYSQHYIYLAILIAGIGLVLITCSLFTPRLPYKYPEISSFEKRDDGAVELIFKTNAGRQSAFYIPPKRECSRLEYCLVVTYSGWLSRALEWQEFTDKVPNPNAAFLLLEYPGYGRCQGRMKPGCLYENFNAAFSILAAHLNTQRPELLKRCIFLGHSFGCYAALQAAVKGTNGKVKRVVLLAPFTSLRSTAFHMYGPLGWLTVPWALNNKAQITQLSRCSPRPELVIIHGTEDTTVPVQMGRKLAKLFPNWIDYREIKGADHSNLFDTYQDHLFKALEFRPERREEITAN